MRKVSLTKTFLKLIEERLNQSYYPEWLLNIEKFCELWPPATYGPGHAVLNDYNLSDDAIQFCLGQCDNPEYDKWGHTETERFATSAFLTYLLEIPEEEREAWGHDDDGNCLHP